MTLYVPVVFGVVATVVMAPAWAAIDSGATGAMAAEAATVAAPAASPVAAAEAQPAANEVVEKELTAEEKAQDEANKKAQECEDALAASDGKETPNVKAKCKKPDVTTATPKGSDGTETKAAEGNIPANGLGADRRDQAHYNPPQNLKVNGQEMSWAKYESFRQIGVSKGHTEASIAAVAGRLQVESLMFSPTKSGVSAVGDNGKSFGQAQWHKERGTDMVNYVNNQRSTRAAANDTTYNKASLSKAGLKYSAFDQSNFVFDEMSSQMSAANYKALKTATNPAEAARLFTVYYERPASQGGQAFGRAGGNATLNNALGFYKAGDNPYIPDTSPLGSRKLADYTSGVSGAGSEFTSQNGLTGGLGNALTSLLGGNGNNLLSGLLGGNGSASDLLTQALSSLLGGGSGSSEQTMAEAAATSGVNAAGTVVRTDTVIEADGSTKTTTLYADGSSKVVETAATTTAAVTGGFDLISAMSSLCGKGLPRSSDALMLMINECRSVLGSA